MQNNPSRRNPSRRRQALPFILWVGTFEAFSWFVFLYAADDGPFEMVTIRLRRGRDVFLIGLMRNGDHFEVFQSAPKLMPRARAVQTGYVFDAFFLCIVYIHAASGIIPLSGKE